MISRHLVCTAYTYKVSADTDTVAPPFATTLKYVRIINVSGLVFTIITVTVSHVMIPVGKIVFLLQKKILHGTPNLDLRRLFRLGLGLYLATLTGCHARPIDGKFCRPIVSFVVLIPQDINIHWGVHLSSYTPFEFQPILALSEWAQPARSWSPEQRSRQR